MIPLKEAAKWLGISRSKLYAKVSRREIAHYRIDGKILFAEADLETFLESCRVELAGAEAPRQTHRPFTTLDGGRLSEAWRQQGARDDHQGR
jgi:excisionase family DNA binding protein